MPPALTPCKSSVQSWALTLSAGSSCRAGIRRVLIAASTGARCWLTPGTHLQMYCHAACKEVANP